MAVMRATVNFPTHTPASYIGWRVLHKHEGGYSRNPDGMPSVVPPLSSVAVWMTEEIQRMSYNLMRHFNQAITGAIWRRCHSHDRAFNNFIGFPNSNGGDLRRDYINQRDLQASYPGYDKAQRLVGGQFVRGEVRGDKLVMIAGVHGVDRMKPMPDIQTIVNNNWYMRALNVKSQPSPFGGIDWDQGDQGPVVFPFIWA